MSSEVRPVVEGICADKLADFLLEYPNDAKVICGKIVEAARAREAARKATRDDASQGWCSTAWACPASWRTVRRKTRRSPAVSGGVTPPAAPPSRAPTASSRRSCRCVAKVLNVEKARYDKVISSEQIDADHCDGHRLWQRQDDYNPDKLRYHRIIIMTDADVDGIHPHASAHLLLPPDD